MQLMRNLPKNNPLREMKRQMSQRKSRERVKNQKNGRIRKIIAEKLAHVRFILYLCTQKS